MKKNYARGYHRLLVGGAATVASLIILTLTGWGWLEWLGVNPSPWGLTVPHIPSPGDFLPTLKGGWGSLVGEWFLIGVVAIATGVVAVALLILVGMAVHKFAGLLGGPVKDIQNKDFKGTEKGPSLIEELFPWRRYSVGYLRILTGGVMIVGIVFIGFVLAEAWGKNPISFGLTLPHAPSWDGAREFFLRNSRESLEVTWFSIQVPPAFMEAGWGLLLRWFLNGVLVTFVVAFVAAVAIVIAAVVHLMAGLVGGPKQTPAPRTSIHYKEVKI